MLSPTTSSWAISGTRWCGIQRVPSIPRRSATPAQVLTRVDAILTGLRIGSLATALVARLEPSGNSGLCTLRWSSAGHLPPLLLRPDGSVQVLVTSPERLLGTEFPRPRTDHEVALRAGDTVVLYTDGLIEHARTGIDDGIVRLADALPELAELPLEKLCDQLLDRIVAARADDDIALLALRCHAGNAEPTS